jgi:hypothetical protein
MTAVIQLFGLHGELLSEQQRHVDLEAHRNILLGRPDLSKMHSGVCFLRLRLVKERAIIDENLYWISGTPRNYGQLNELKEVKVHVSVDKPDTGPATVSIENPGTETAFFMRLKLLHADNELALPAFFSDNYITLMPGEARKIQLDYSLCGGLDGGSGLKLAVEGWNVLLYETRL